MGARELLHELAGAGFIIEARAGSLVVRPASKLTDELRASLRAAKPDLLALLSGHSATSGGPYRLTAAEADAAHARPWDDAACARFVGRVARFIRRGIDATDADDLADRLHLRDVAGDDRALCIECAHYRLGRCNNHKTADLSSPEVSLDLAAMLQRCPGFEPAC